MRLNTLTPGAGSRRSKKRLGRGISAGRGKTCGRGQKGQHARSGGFHKVGFEGGQMPLQRRLPKVGFNSRKSRFSAEVRLSELESLGVEDIDLNVLRNADLIPQRAQRVKIIASGEISTAVKILGVRVTPGARKAIEAAGGSIEDKA